ncbi:RNA polymerase sigma factor [Streptomyces wuyuanensis]|uniref:RNA polymerase sigma factor n=1 Tax=Streptomyces wuyuanensis TaxID=1196353 RepID=UPI003D7319D5
MDEPQTAAPGRTALRTAPVLREAARQRMVDARFDFARFYTDHIASLTRFVMRLGATPYEAADAAHTAFTEAFPQWAQIASPGAWLRTVAARCYLRQTGLRDRPVENLPDRPGGGCPVAAVVLKEEEERVYRALHLLPPKQRQVMAWHLDGYSHAEIGRQLGMTAEAVRQNYARARSGLKRSLGLSKGEEE